MSALVGAQVRIALAIWRADENGFISTTRIDMLFHDLYGACCPRLYDLLAHMERQGYVLARRGSRLNGNGQIRNLWKLSAKSKREIGCTFAHPPASTMQTISTAQA